MSLCVSIAIATAPLPVRPRSRIILPLNRRTYILRSTLYSTLFSTNQTTVVPCVTTVGLCLSADP